MESINVHNVELYFKPMNKKIKLKILFALIKYH